MAKTPQRKPSPKPQRNTARAESPEFFRNVRLQSGLIFAFAFLLYANTLKHGFVLDDGIVITENMYTQQGIKGVGGILSHDTFFGFFKQAGNETLVTGGRYRPLSLVIFAILYQVGGASPFLFHLATVLLFALTCMLLYRTLLKLLVPPNGPAPADTGYKVAWLAAVLFTAHPIHTEVVANIKSCDEILALLGSLGALFYALKAWDTGVRKWAITAGIVFFAACLSKENAVAYVVLIPLALYFFRPNQPEGSPSIWGTVAPVFAAFAAFFLIRGSILPWSTLTGGNEPMELMNNPFLKLEGGQWVKFAPVEKLATIFYTLWKYVQLLFVPHPLTHDYYPRHIDMMSFGNPMVILSLLLYGFMAYWIVKGIKQRDITAYGLLLFLLPLGIVSNLLFPVGTNMSERFAFMPSVGFCLLAGWFLTIWLDKNKSQAMGLFAVVVLLFSIKTVSRNFVWESNDRLFMTDVAVSENSVKLQTAAAKSLVERAKKEKISEKKREMCQEAVTRLNKALQFYPNFKTDFIIRGEAYAVMQQFPEAIADYRKALSLAPEDPKRKTMLAFTLREAGRYQGDEKHDVAAALQYLNEAWQLNATDPETARLLGVANVVQGKMAEAVEWYKKAEDIAPKDAESLWELSVAYANIGQNEKAQELGRRALAIDPGIAQKVANGLPLDR